MCVSLVENYINNYSKHNSQRLQGGHMSNFNRRQTGYFENMDYIAVTGILANPIGFD